MNDETNTSDEKKHSLGARIMAAIGFSAVGGKLFIPGAVIDANNIVGSELTLGEKFKGVLSKQFLQKIEHEAVKLIDKEKYLVASPIKRYGMGLIAFLKVTKWSTIIGTAGGVTGFAIGWVQGGKIENWKDIFTHPIRSTKIIFGIEKASTEIAPKKTEPLVTVEETLQAPAKEWAKDMVPRNSHEAALVQEKALETAPSIS